MISRLRRAPGLILLLCFALVACDDRATDRTGGTVPAAPSAFKASHPRVRAASSGAPTGRIMAVVTADRAETLDPHNTESGGDVKVINQIYETLVRIDPGNADRLRPALAESWQIAEDGLSITFTIRSGVIFHDGAPLDAEAARLSLERLRGGYLDVPAAPYRVFFDFIADLHADGLRLSVHLHRPIARIALRNLSMFPASIISPRLLRATEVMESGARSTFISEWASGTGPYYLNSLESSEARVRLGAFDRYWNGAPSIRRIVFRQVADPNSQIEYLRSGEADMLDDVPRPIWDAFEAEPDVHLHRWWALNLCYLGVNVRHLKTAEIEVRRAIRLAIDRTELKQLYYGTARETHSLVAQPLAEYDPHYRAPGTDAPLPERLARAKGMIREAGAEGRTLKIYYPMHPRPYLPTPQKIADKLRQQLRRIKLAVEITAVPNSELFASIRNDRYELVLIGWMSDNADPDNFYIPLASGDPLTGTPAPTNCGRAFDPVIHEALIRAQAITDPRARIDLYRNVERKLQESIVGYVPLLNTQQAHAFGPRLEGVEIDPLGHYRFQKAKATR